MNFTVSPVNTTLDGIDWESLEDSWKHFRCYMNHSQFLDFLHDIKWKGHLAHINILSLLYGPILWTVALVGMMLNLMAIIIIFMSGFNSTSILIGCMSTLFLIKAGNMCLINDMIRGNLCI